MKKIYLSLLLFITINPIFSQKNISLQFAAARASSFSQIVNKNEVGMMKGWANSNISIDGNIGYQITPKKSLTLGLSYNDYSWEVRMKSPENSFTGREYFKQMVRYKMDRRDGYNMLLNLKLKSQVFHTQKSNLSLSLGMGMYCTFCLAFEKEGKYFANNKNNQLTNSETTPLGANNKPFMYTYAGDNFKYFYHWNFAPSIGLEYGILHKKNEIGVFVEGMISLRKNYEFNLYYFENKNREGLTVPPTETAKIVNRGLMLRTGVYYRFNDVINKVKSNPIKNEFLPWLKKVTSKVPNDTFRTAKINIFYGLVNGLPSSLIVNSQTLNVSTKPNNEASISIGFTYDRRLKNKLWNIGIGLNLRSSGNDINVRSDNNGERLIEDYFTILQLPIFLNRNFYCLDKKVLLHTYVGTHTNLLISSLRQASGALTPQFSNGYLYEGESKLKPNTRFFGKLAISIPKYTKGLQFFIMYSGFMPKKLEETGYKKHGEFKYQSGSFSDYKDFRVYYNPIYISFGIAYDFNVSKRQKKIVEYY